MGIGDSVNGAVSGALGGGLSGAYTSRFGSVEQARGNPNGLTIPGIPPDGVQNPMWTTVSPDETRWDANFPFQLIIVKRQPGTSGSTYAPVGGGTFTLPIPPQAMRESLPFAVQVEVMQSGIVEQHNGIPLRPIILQGTTGVFPGRGTGPVLDSPNLLGSIFSGTVNAARNFVNALPSVLTGSNVRPNVVSDDELTSKLHGTTGYYQFQLLKKFLEQYSFMKLTKAGRDYRLAFAHWKTQEVFLVSLGSFDGDQAAPDSLEWKYSLVFKAWRRINLTQGEIASSLVTPAIFTPGAMQQILSNVIQARNALDKLKDVIAAVGQDVDRFMETVREIGLFIKDLQGIALNAADLPTSIQVAMKSPILEAIGPTAKSVGSAFSGDISLGFNLNATVQAIGSFSVTTGKATTQSGVGVKQQAVTSTNPDPANKVLENPQDNYPLFSQIEVGKLNLPPSIVRKIVQERQRVRQFTRIDFEKRRDSIKNLLLDFEALVGASDPTFNRISGRADVVTTRTPTSEDFEVIFNLNATLQEVNKLSASGTIGDQNKLTALEYVAGLASRSGIPFQVPASQIQIPFPYKSTLEQIARRYLGNPDRWFEIAALNRLRQPYVDEEGFDLPLLVNGNRNQVVVSDSTNLFVGQPVWLSSNTSRRQKRRILSLDIVSVGNVVVGLDGDPDLASLTTVNAAKLHAYLPDTVNSQMLLLIPSTKTPDNADFESKSIPGIDQFQLFLDIGGIDLLLTTSGDAAITNNGDWKFAVGKQNLVQKVRTWATTPRGSMIRRPNFGIALRPGTSTADLSAQELLAGAKDLVAFDPVFTGVKSASVLQNGPTVSFSVTFNVSGSNLALPVTVDVKR